VKAGPDGYTGAKPRTRILAIEGLQQAARTRGGTVRRLTILICLLALPLWSSATAGAGTPQAFHATFHDVAFQNSCSPPIVFCGSGVVSGYGQATTVVRVTSIVPISGSACMAVAGTREITLEDGTGTLVASFSGVRCPLGEGGHAFRIEFSYTITGGSGVFAGATGSGTGINTTAGNVQVVSLAGTITLP
jgi:hypothetical protein